MQIFPGLNAFARSTNGAGVSEKHPSPVCLTGNKVEQTRMEKKKYTCSKIFLPSEGKQRTLFGVEYLQTTQQFLSLACGRKAKAYS